MIDTGIRAKNLKLLRTMRGISQDELSAAIYTARTTYASYENGTKVPSLPCIDAIASFYDIGLESLVNHDLSTGLLSRIYFEDENKQLAELVNEYESLSIASKNIVAERLDVLLERESVFYGETSTYSDASAQ